MVKIERSNKKLVSNIISNGIYQILTMIVPIITLPYISRVFLPEQIGMYSLTLSVASLFVILANAGMPLYGSREVAQSKNDDETNWVFNELWKSQLINTAIWSILYLFYVFFFTDGNYLYYTQAGLVFVSGFDISWFYVGQENIKVNIFRNVFTKIFVMIMIFVFIKSEDDLGLYCTLNIIGMLLGNLSMFIGLNKYITVNQTFPKQIKTVLTKSYKLMNTQLIASLQAPAERTILNVLDNSTSSVGIYDQGIKIINLLFAVINSGINALMPRMSYEVSEGNFIKVRAYTKKALLFSTIFSVITVSGIYNVADSFVLFFFGRGYEPVATVLKITSISLFFMPMSTFLSNGLLIPLKRDRLALYGVSIITLSSIAVNLVLDSKYSIYGISVAFVMSTLLGFAFRIYYTRDFICVKNCIFFLLVSFLLCIINVQIVNLINNSFQIGIGILAFFINGILSVLSNIIFGFFIYLFTKYKPR